MVRTCADRYRPVKVPGDRVKGVDLTMKVAKVANQQMVAEPTETRRCHGDPPRRGEATARDQLLDKVAIFIENRYGPFTQ